MAAAPDAGLLHTASTTSYGRSALLVNPQDFACDRLTGTFNRLIAVALLVTGCYHRFLMPIDEETRDRPILEMPGQFDQHGRS
jgi:hypothetical protein